MYAFPPIPLIQKIVRKIQQDIGAKMIVIAPAWLHQLWFSHLLQLSGGVFEHLPLSPNMLPQQEDRIFHLDPVALPWSVGDWTLTLPALERFLACA